MSGTVVVTGGGGFVGSAVVRLCVKTMMDTPPKFSDGTSVQHVVALLRPGGSQERLQELPESGQWSIEHADITNGLELRNLLARIRPRAILHLAADQNIFRNLPEAKRHRVNIAPVQTMFEGLASVPGGRLVHTSSAWVLPAGESLDESTPLEPRSAYAENKAWADRLLPVVHEKTGVNWMNLRLFNIFGKYESTSRLIPYLASRLTQGKVAELSSGDHIRDFSDVEDIARAYLLALQAGESACNRVYHIGSGRGISLREFAMTVAEVTGNAGLIRFGSAKTRDRDVSRQVANPSLAKRVLQWSPGGDLEGRIQATVRWWLKRWGVVNLLDPARSPAAPSSVAGK